MPGLAPTPSAGDVEAASRAFWESRRIPPLSVGANPTGTPTHLLFGTLPPKGTPTLSALQRLLIADVAARYLTMAGRNADGTMLFDLPAGAPLPGGTLEVAGRLGLWVGARRAEAIVDPQRGGAVGRMLGRLAERSILTLREEPVRLCPRCGVPRSPERIVYQEEEGPAYLVRFPLQGMDPPTSLLVWTDAAWKLLGTCAVLVSPELPYVVARYRRRGVEERVVVGRSAVERLKEWLPGCEVEIVEEKAGTELAKMAYHHPLSHEFPALRSLPAPAGTVIPSPDVGDSGTGIVTLVPAHGAADAQVARSLEVAGWPVVTASGVLDEETSHKYAGLPLDTAESFVFRDLSDGGFIFAQLRVRRGVPHCDGCGTALLWHPQRLWTLEPGRLDAEGLADFARLLPGETVPRAADLVPWPASEGNPSDEETAPALLECAECERLAPLGKEARCACGGERTEVRRRLVPALSDVIYAWSRLDPFRSGESVWLMLSERRRAPALLHHLVARSALGAQTGELRLNLLPTFSPAEEGREIGESEPVDVLRFALVSLSAPGHGAGDLGAALVRQRRELHKFWELARNSLELVERSGFAPDARPIAALAEELEPEDRGFLSHFEATRREALSLFDRGRFAEALDRVERQIVGELRDRYLPLVRRRLALEGPSRTGVLSVLHYALPLAAELLAPFAPFTMEAVHRGFRPEAVSLFERRFSPISEGLIDEAAEREYRVRQAILGSVERGRSWLGLAPETLLPRLVLVLNDDERWSQFRAAREAFARLAGATQVEVAYPSAPWEGRIVDFRPVPQEIQRVYGAAGGRIVAMLRQTPARKIREGIEKESLQVVLDGQAIRILPSMVELTDRLPDNVVVFPWPRGELYLELPGGTPPIAPERRLPLSFDARRLVERLRRTVGHLPRDGPRPAEVALFVPPPLAAELAPRTESLREILGLAALRVATQQESVPRAESFWGRTRRGVRWRVWVRGVALPRRQRKARTVRRRVPRVPRVPPETEGEPGIDFASEPEVRRAETIREIIARMDTELGRPLLGPSKLGYAWEAGFPGFDALAHAPFDRLKEIPGFGPYVAQAIASHFGDDAPPAIFIAPVTSLSPETDAEGGAALPSFSDPAATTAPGALPLPALAEAQAAPVPGAPGTTEPSPTTSSVGAPTLVRPSPSASASPLTPASSWNPFLSLRTRGGAGAGPPPSLRPPEGVQLTESESTEGAWARFLELTAGAPGLCVSREFPHRVRTRIGPRSITVVWLSNVGRDEAIRPGDLEGLRELLLGAITEGNVRAILLEGAEYLITIHSLPKFVDFLRSVDGHARTAHAAVLAPVNPDLLAPNAIEELRRAFPPPG